MQRFDKVQRERDSHQNDGVAEPVPTANGAMHADEPETVAETVEQDAEPSPPPSVKRKADDSDDDEDSLSDVKDTPPPKKAKKGPKPEAESDEQMAKRLQAEFSSTGGRSTRGGGSTKKKPAAKKEKKTKKKSAAKVHSDDDSEVDGSSSPKPEKEKKKGGFNKPMNLSEPLRALVGESQLSRPQTVKRIWAYVKERDLQEPSDKRQIRCDDVLRAVFKADKIHMFTMNKVLAGHFYPVEEEV